MAKVASKSIKLKQKEFTLTNGEFYSIHTACLSVIPATESVPTIWSMFTGRVFRYLRELANKNDSFKKNQQDEFKAELDARHLRYQELLEAGEKNINVILKDEFSDLSEAEEKAYVEHMEWLKQVNTIILPLLPADFQVDLKVNNSENKNQQTLLMNWVEMLREED